MNSKKTKRALLSSVLALVLCFSMMLGTTFAWFTDSVTSTGNIIKSGTLDVEMTWANKLDGEYKDASEGAIFNYQHWEPGYTDIKYVKIANVGNLAFKYQLNVVPTAVAAEGEVNLADVIDVYMVMKPTAEVTRESMATTMQKVGTLTDLMADVDGAAHGILIPEADKIAPNFEMPAEGTYEQGSFVVGIALKMQESAGNEYQNLTVGGDFKVQLYATQYTAEIDSFDHLYDENADFAPKADVKVTGAKMVDTSTHGAIMANTTFQFLPTESYDEAQQSYYRYWHADFVVSADKDIPANAVILPGYYQAYADFTGDQRWIGLSSDEIIPAGTEIRLVYVMGGGNITVNYEEICKWGNDNVGFLCGVSDQSYGELAGTTLTVELRLYETYTEEEAIEKFGVKSTNYEKADYETDGKDYYTTIGTYTYTFGTPVEVTMTEDIAVGDNEYFVIPEDGTLNLNGYTLSAEYVSAAGDAVISNGTLELTADGYVYPSEGSNITLENVVIDSDNLSVMAYTGGTITLKNVTVKNTSTSNPVQNYGGTLILENVTVAQEGDANTAWYSSAIQVINEIAKNDETGKYEIISQANTTIESGNYTGKKAIMVSAPGGNVTINGGNFTGSEYVIQADFAPQNYTYGSDYESVITINGGNFTGAIKVSGSAELVIKGGTFSVDPSAYVDTDAYTVTEAEGLYTVTAK